MPQRREPWPPGSEMLEVLPVPEIPALRSERQLVFVRGYHESFCRSIPGRPPAQLALLTPTVRRRRPRFAPSDAAELLSAEEQLSSTGYRIDPTTRVGARFSRAIRGSFPSQPASPLDADRGRDAAAGLTRLATALEIRKTWDRSEEHTSELQSRGHLVCRLL